MDALRRLPLDEQRDFLPGKFLKSTLREQYANAYGGAVA